jgi:hypothetical protein
MVAIPGPVHGYGHGFGQGQNGQRLRVIKHYKKLLVVSLGGTTQGDLGENDELLAATSCLGCRADYPR